MIEKNNPIQGHRHLNISVGPMSDQKISSSITSAIQISHYKEEIKPSKGYVAPPETDVNNPSYRTNRENRRYDQSQQIKL